MAEQFYQNEIITVPDAAAGTAVTSADITVTLSTGAIISGYAKDTADATMPNTAVVLLKGTSVETALPEGYGQTDSEGFYMFSIETFDALSSYYVKASAN